MSPPPPGRRLLYAVAPLLAILALTELAGRLLRAPDASEARAALYEPGAVLVRAGSDPTRHETARAELHAQSWAVPASAYRVAFVGDSTVWGQLPEAFAQGLDLGGRAPEVLNLGIRGAASDRARIAAEAAVREDIDLLVVYVGHNEVTEARLNPFSLRPFWERRLLGLVLGSGTARLLGGALDPLRATTDPAALTAKGDAAARPLSAEEWAPIAASYRRNLEGICALANPATIVFVEPISSLVHPGEAPAGTPAVLASALESGLSAARLGDPTDALAWADRLRGYYPDLGPPRALRGIGLLVQGAREEALAELREARRRDAQPARATEDHWRIVREVAAGCGATVVATEPAFLADPRYLSLDDPLFMDRVHPTLPGNVLLAGVIAGAAPLPAGARFVPANVTLTPPADEVARGWRLSDQKAAPP